MAGNDRGCVFVGPTVGPDQVRESTSITVLPPAAVGDVYQATLAGFDPILLIDGYFHSVPSVQHKEILFAMSQGVRVFGCSSMGALRAAELADHGMVGIGEVFRQYRTGTCTDDDEVAVAHGDADSGYRALSEPMVNIRHALCLAVDRGLVSDRTARRLSDIAKSLFYADRHWAAIRAEGHAVGLPEAELNGLVEFLRTETPDLKRDDALDALRALSERRLGARVTERVMFEETYGWSLLVRSSSQ